MCDEKLLQNLIGEIRNLKTQMKQLQAVTVKTDANKKIPHSVLPAGFSEVNVANLQLESLHSAAAAACRGSTPSGGTGCCENAVLPRSRGLSCNQVCASTMYKHCDAE